jgi:hypothetical protein
MAIKNGDFADFLEQSTRSQKAAQDAKPGQTHLQSGAQEHKEFDSEAFTEMLMDEEKLEAYAAKMRADDDEQAGFEPMTEQEFERQALEAGGSDNNPETPE